MSAMGVKIDHFDVPVCNSFQAKVLNDQLCYEVDPNKFKNFSTVDELRKRLELKIYVDINEDRQAAFKDSIFKIHLNTLGRQN